MKASARIKEKRAIRFSRCKYHLQIAGFKLL